MGEVIRGSSEIIRAVELHGHLMREVIRAHEGYSEAVRDAISWRELKLHRHLGFVGASIRRNQGSSGAISEHRHLGFVGAAETAAETFAAAEAALAAGEGRKREAAVTPPFEAAASAPHFEAAPLPRAEGGSSAQVERRVVRLLVEVGVAETLGVEPKHPPCPASGFGAHVARLAAQVQCTDEDVYVVGREAVLPHHGDRLPNVLCLPPRDKRAQVCREGHEGIYLMRMAIGEETNHGISGNQ